MENFIEIKFVIYRDQPLSTFVGLGLDMKTQLEAAHKWLFYSEEFDFDTCAMEVEASSDDIKQAVIDFMTSEYPKLKVGPLV